LTYIQVTDILLPVGGKGECFMETTATSKGQIVIPSSVRRKFGIKEGTRIQIEVDDAAKEIILKPITREYVHSLRGKFKGKGLLEELMAEKQRERKL
jgi:AbrB family looped-hinge helix DNA binding protein